MQLQSLAEPEGGLRGLAPQRMRKNIKASRVNLTVNMRYKMTNNIKFVITRFVFFSSSKCNKICFRLTTLPRLPIVGWGRGYPLPIPLPTRRLRRLELGASVLKPPQHKILATPVTAVKTVNYGCY